jgi:hypothetical protein
MSAIRENMLVFVTLIAAIAALLAYLFSAYVEKTPKEGENGAAKKAALKTFVFVALAGSAIAWATKPETRATAPFQES